MTHYYSDLGGASDWIRQISTNQKHYFCIPGVAHDQYGISVLLSQNSFRRETTHGIAKCQLFLMYVYLYISISYYFFTDTQPSEGFSDSQDKEIFEGISLLTN